jgi:hypothetical protein
LAARQYFNDFQNESKISAKSIKQLANNYLLFYTCFTNQNTMLFFFSLIMLILEKQQRKN